MRGRRARQARRVPGDLRASGTSTATVIGEVNDTERLTVEWHGESIVDVPPRTVAHEGPVYERPFARPADQDALQADDAGVAAAPVDR